MLKTTLWCLAIACAMFLIGTTAHALTTQAGVQATFGWLIWIISYLFQPILAGVIGAYLGPRFSRWLARRKK